MGVIKQAAELSVLKYVHTVEAVSPGGLMNTKEGQKSLLPSVGIGLSRIRNEKPYTHTHTHTHTKYMRAWVRAWVHARARARACV